MPGIRVCGACGVPRRLTRQHEWLSNGVIVQRKNPVHRMVFLESENINATFRGVEEIIEMSIERIITESKRRATFDFVDHILPGPVKTVLRFTGVKPAIRSISRLARVMGYGNVELAYIRRVHDEGDYAVMHNKELYSIPLFCGDVAGTFNAIDRREVAVSYRELGPDEYEVTGHISNHPLELQERLHTRLYTNKDGDVELEKCVSCGGPQALSDYQWHLDRGVINNRAYGHRMAMIGPASLDAIIDDLEGELGDTIPQVVIEAQRRIVRGGFYSLEEARSAEDFRRAFALRGLGNLKEIAWSDRRLHFHMENPCLHLMLVGLVHGVYELVNGREAKTEWELTGDGDLVVEVTAV
jgi:ribosomal protein L37E